MSICIEKMEKQILNLFFIHKLKSRNLCYFYYFFKSYEIDIVEHIFNLPLVFSLADFCSFKKPDKKDFLL